MPDFGKRMRTVRGILTVKEFAKRIGVTKGSVQRFEKGAIPKVSTLDRVCSEFNVDMGWLLGYSEAGQGDDLYLAGRREERVIEGARFKIQHVTPESVIETADERRGEVREKGVDSFGAAVSALREIYDHDDPLTRAALESNLALFKVSSKLMSEYRMMQERAEETQRRLSDLEDKVAALERILSEHRPPPETGERRRNWDQLKTILNITDGHPAEERIKP